MSGRAAVVAAIFGVSMLGNLRLHASEVPRRLPDPAVVATSAAADAASRRFLDAGVASGFDSDADGIVADRETASDDADDGRLVPAIYAWDPDVRFVYYRHVSKWM